MGILRHLEAGMQRSPIGAVRRVWYGGSGGWVVETPKAILEGTADIRDPGQFPWSPAARQPYYFRQGGAVHRDPGASSSMVRRVPCNILGRASAVPRASPEPTHTSFTLGLYFMVQDPSG